ncbi:hypothetical protein NIIDMKKI_26180 [Mycobacterium kansasii]|uniref:Uncharacterized protein n=1 Tax=Mycobacterium kansasii TaxID=1768 RepID=A0A7G1IC15_MYCKA|nr:hypothetical protein NIIDMKKI_26180 [Mycobacterium kansasii]
MVTAPRPQLTAAIGAALRAARGPADTSATVLTSAPPIAATALAPLAPLAPGGADAPASAVQPALAWSEAEEDSHVMPVPGGDYADAGGSGYTSARPQLAFEHDTPRSRSLSRRSSHGIACRR